jgi:hypothetical protein
MAMTSSWLAFSGCFRCRQLHLDAETYVKSFGDAA